VNRKKTLLLIFFFSLLSFLFSFVIEHALNTQPCSLCLIQRWIFFFIADISLLIILFNKLRFLLVLSIIFGFFVSSYHNLVVFDILKGKCQTEQIIKTSKEDFFKTLEKKSDCKNPPLFFSIPLPVFSVFLFTFLLILNRLKPLKIKRTKTVHSE
jgi:disulfide bond formation protein DsbB